MKPLVFFVAGAAVSTVVIGRRISREVTEIFAARTGSPHRCTK